MIRIVAILVFWSTLFSCQKEPHSLDLPVCEVQNPLVDLPWLKAIAIDQKTFSLQIEQGSYHGRTVYIVSTCMACFAGGIATIYGCEGTEICHFGTYVLEPNPSCKNLYQDEIADKKVLLSR